MDKLREIKVKAKDGFNKMDKKKRTTMVILLVGIILFTSLYTYFTNKSNYVVLFNNLEFEDAGFIANDLESKKINYKLEDNGRKILIDDRYVDEYRLQLAMEGNMPENSSGFEMFDNVGIMATDEDRKIMYQRALSGELQRSIMSLDAVNTAKVHLVMSNKSIFETEAKDASASVILDLVPFERITNNTIRGIAALVSGAVDNLPLENIQIIDSKGNLLSQVLQEDTFNATNIVTQYQDIKANFERQMESNVMDLLGDVFGRDKIKIAINTDLDFDSQETTTIRYEDPVVRSQQFSISGEDISTRDDYGGLIGDNPSAVIENITGEGSTYESTINHELSTETSTTIKAPGKINKMTTSVVYDGPLTTEQVGQIENIVATATGYDYARNDIINVVGISFDRGEGSGFIEEPIPEEAEQIILEEYGQLIAISLASVLVLIVGILVTRSILRKRKKEKVATVDPFEEFMKMPVTTQEKKEIDITIDEYERKAKEYAKNNPDLAADLIKVWLKN